MIFFTARVTVALHMQRARRVLGNWRKRWVIQDARKKWSNWALAAALALPDLLQFVLANFDMVSAVAPQIDPVTKERLRYALLALAFVLRNIRQDKDHP